MGEVLKLWKRDALGYRFSDCEVQLALDSQAEAKSSGSSKTGRASEVLVKAFFGRHSGALGGLSENNALEQ